MVSRFLSARSFIDKSIRSTNTLPSLLLLLGSGFGVLAAYLVVNGYWQISLLLIAVIPGLILLHRYPFSAICIWLVLTPFLLHTDAVSVRWVYWVIHRGLPPLTLGIILLGSALQIYPRKLPRLNPADLCMLAYIAVSLISIFLQNGDPQATSYQFYDRVIAPMCLYWIIRLSNVYEKQVKWLLPVALFISISQSIFGVLSWYAPQILPADWLSQEGSRTIGSLVNPSVFTVAIVFSGLLLLQAGLSSKSRLVRWAFVITFLLSAYSVFVSFSRASWLAAIVVALGLIYIYPKFMFKGGLMLLPVVLVLGGWALSSQIQWASQRLYSTESERSALSRLPVMVAAYRMFQVKPVFGWGYGNFDLYDRPFQGRFADLSNDNKDHASHNLYLTLIAEQGIVGFALFLGPLGWWLVKSVKKRQDLPRAGFWSKKLLIILWLGILTHIVVNNFANMRVVYGLGMWWINLALIANLVSTPGWADQRIRIPRDIYPLDRPARWPIQLKMGKNIERLWVSFINSNAFRNFSKRGAGSAIFRSQTYQEARLRFNDATSHVQSLRYPTLFKDVNTFCLFIGHNKSGTSMVGSLLDAHPDVIISDEADALEYVSAGFSKEQIFHILLKISHRELLKGRVTARRLKPYSYLVPDQWQGRYQTLRVIGDSTSGSTTQRFARDPDLLGQLQGLMTGIDVKFIQVIRNPYDPISVMMVRGKRSFENSINHYFTSCETLVRLREQIPASHLLAVKYEDFVNQPVAGLIRICQFLGIEANSGYMRACTQILHQQPDKNRHMVNWDSEWIKLVETKIAQYDFLEGYSFDN